MKQIIALLLFVGCAFGQTETYQLVTQFPEVGIGNAPLARDTIGQLYATFSFDPGGGYGQIVRVNPMSGAQTILWNFTGGFDGSAPRSGVILDSAGNLYGAATAGGTNNSGVVFELSAATQALSPLFAFDSVNAPQNGYDPTAGLALDGSGNLYGTTTYGGISAGPCAKTGCGVVFKLTPDGTFTVLHAFEGTGGDGYLPLWAVAVDSAGDVFGTTQAGGSSQLGVLYEITAAGAEVILHSFTGNPGWDSPQFDGSEPYGVPLIASDGTIYGTTEAGGAYGHGTVWSYANGAATILHSFAGLEQGRTPVGYLTLETGQINALYGVTNAAYPANGLLWKLALPSLNFKTIEIFGNSEPGVPAYSAPLVLPANGKLFLVGPLASMTPTGLETPAIYRISITPAQ